MPPGTATTSNYPITVTNCGFEVTVEDRPERIVAIRSTVFELLAALGASDRMVGAAFLDGVVPEPWREEAATVPIISDHAPASEPVLELEPDLIVAGWESNLAPDTAGDRDFLADAGIATYVAPSACQSAQQPDKLTYPLLFSEFAELGELIGAPEAAAALIADQQQQLADVPQLAEPATALWWSSASDIPFVGGGIGAPQMVMDAVGLTNVAADIQQTWTSLGWEAIVDADPQVFVLVDSKGNSADNKIQLLEDNPSTAQLEAVQQQRFVVIPFAAAEAGVRSVGAAADIAEQLAELGFETG